MQRHLFDFSRTIDDIYENLKNYKQTKRTKLLIVLSDVMTTDMEAN